MSEYLHLGSASCAPSSAAIAIGAVSRVGRAFHILAPGQLNFIDSEGVTVNMAAGFFAAGGIYPYAVKEILAGTTATGRVLY